MPSPFIPFLPSPRFQSRTVAEESSMLPYSGVKNGGLVTMERPSRYIIAHSFFLKEGDVLESFYEQILTT